MSWNSGPGEESYVELGTWVRHPKPMTPVMAIPGGAHYVQVIEAPMAETAQSERRLQRELTTVRAMIGMYCRDHHDTRDALCADCEQLWQYAQARVDHCPFGADKPTCAKCTVHCYKRDMREQIRNVMRYAGPRMMWRHPWLALMHIVHGRDDAPVRGR